MFGTLVCDNQTAIFSLSLSRGRSESVQTGSNLLLAMFSSLCLVETSTQAQVLSAACMLECLIA
jgi:hypothetical protein